MRDKTESILTKCFFVFFHESALMSDRSPSPSHLMDKTDDLSDLRREIDALDAKMHHLLMARGELIDRLITVKKTDQSGSAFRPQREAEMMKALAARHQGSLPFETVEAIWRVIIATFTYIQAPYTLYADSSIEAALMQDTARFHFGFTVPYRPLPDAEAVMEAVGQSRGDIGLIAVKSAGLNTAFWRDKLAQQNVKVLSTLPFTQKSEGHPAHLPVLVLTKDHQAG
jgi:chorismate mutase